MTVYDWAASYTEAQRVEHSFSVAARHERVIRRVESFIYPVAHNAVGEVALAITSADPELMLAALRKLASIGELARFEAEKLEGRA